MAHHPLADALTRKVLGVDALLDGLRPSSAAAKARPLPVYREEDLLPWQQEMASLKEAQAFYEAHPERCLKISKHLRELPELERPSRRLAAGEPLGDAELFELKRFFYFSREILREGAQLLDLWATPQAWPGRLEELMKAMHPEEEPSPRFFLSEALDEGLRQARTRERLLKKELNQARRLIEEALINAHGGAFDLEGYYRPSPGVPVAVETLLEAGLVQDGARLRTSSPAIEVLRSDLALASEEVRGAESALRERLSNALQPELDFVKVLMASLVTLDLRLAKVLLLKALDACWPEVNQAPGYHLQGGRAPTIPDPQPIDFDSGLEPTIVVGPNMGGKSSLLALVGLASWCAQHALPAPAKAFAFTFVDAIIYVGADEPAAQSREEGLSSFGREVRRLVSWWGPTPEQDPSPARLWLLDELARGTHPDEGAELAREIIDTLFERQDLVIAATHFPALAAHKGVRKLRIAGLVHREELINELSALPDDPEALTRALRRAMDYRPIPTDAADVPRDARDIARALGLSLPHRKS